MKMAETATVHIIHVFPGVHQYLAVTVKHIAQGLFLVKPRGSSYHWATQGPPPSHQNSSSYSLLFELRLTTAKG